MLKQYLKAVEWNIRNHAKMTAKDWEDFRRLESEFDIWVGGLPVAERDSVFDQIRAVTIALKIFGQDAKLI